MHLLSCGRQKMIRAHRNFLPKVKAAEYEYRRNELGAEARASKHTASQYQSKSYGCVCVCVCLLYLGGCRSQSVAVAGAGGGPLRAAGGQL